MPRKEKRDKFWEHVEVIKWETKEWRCKYCGKVFTANVQRVKAHLGKVSDKNILNCEKVPEPIMVVAKDAYESPSPYKRRRAESNTGGPPPMDSYVQVQPQGPNPPGGSATQVETGGTSSSSEQQHITNLTGSGSNPTPVTGATGRKYSALEHTMEALERKLRRIAHRLAHKREELDRDIYQIEKCLEKLKVIETEFGTVKKGGNDSSQLETQVKGLASAADELLIRRGIHSESLTPKEQGPEGGAFLLTDPVGEDYKKHMDNLWKYLLGNDISRIGIYGMPGVGKTFLAKHLYNKLYDDVSFEKVFWVTVPKGATIRDLQSEIASAVKAVNIFTVKAAVNIFTEEEDEKERAGLLHGHLKEIGKCVLILDDVWEEFDVKEVGIPIQGLKLVLTTRSLNICRNICEKQIEIGCLLEDGESLFMKHLGCEYDPDEMVEYIRPICDDLPLAIVETAKIMRGRVPELNWLPDFSIMAHAVHEEMDKRIFPILKTSFDELTFQMQQCFLRCALYNDYEKPRSGLIELFIDERLISRSTSRAKMLKEGHLILDGLIDASLLEGWGKDDVVMHGVIRSMALNIMGTKCMLAAGGDWINEKYWPTDLQVASISCFDTPVGFSPNCPELSTLLLDYNNQFTKIPGSFFDHLSGLRVLNLSHSPIEELPDGISELPCLEALLLRECKRLSHIPSLAKLVSLTKLDLLGCAALKEVPDGLECLVNLQYLDLLGTGIPLLQVVVLQKMVKLQYLSINNHVMDGVEFEPTAAVELEYLRCHFEDEKQFHTFMSILQPSQYSLTVGGVGIHRHSSGDELFERLITIYDGVNIREICLPENVQKLVISHSDACLLKFLDCFPKEDINSCTDLVMEDAVSLYLKSPQRRIYLDLKDLKLFKCAGLNYIFSATCYLKNLRTITVEDCVELEGITDDGVQLPDGAFCSLESIHIENCHKMRTLVGHSLLPHLKKLREINVSRCNNMKEIIESNHPVTSRRHSSQSSSSNHALLLLHLEHLHLSGLPELEVIYDGMMECRSIRVISCPKVKRIPLSLPMGADGRLSTPLSLNFIDMDSREQWESLEWPPNEAKTFLNPVFWCY